MICIFLFIIYCKFVSSCAFNTLTLLFGYGSRKSIQPVKKSEEVLAWLFVWIEWLAHGSADHADATTTSSSLSSVQSWFILLVPTYPGRSGKSCAEPLAGLVESAFMNFDHNSLSFTAVNPSLHWTVWFAVHTSLIQMSPPLSGSESAEASQRLAKWRLHTDYELG